MGSSRLVRACDLSAYVGPDGLRFWHGGGELGLPDLCFLRSLGQGTYEQLTARAAILKAMESAGSLVLNPTSALEKVRDKFSTLIALKQAGFLVPRTYLTESSSVAYTACGSIRRFVYKPLIGSLGFGSMLFDDRDLAYNILRLLERHGCPLHIQEFVEDAVRELRVFLISGEIVACAEKMPEPGAWKRNVAQGARMVEAEPPPGLEELCSRVSESLGLFYAGLDVIEVEDGGLVALEVNGAPNWRGLQEATGVDIAELLVGEAVELLRS